MNIYKVIRYLFKSRTIVNSCRFKKLVFLTVKEHNRLSRADKKIIQCILYILVVKGIAMIEESVKAVGKYKLENLL